MAPTLPQQPLNRLSNGELLRVIMLAQGGDDSATEALLEQFRPLLRSRMHLLWTAVRESLSTLEWEDIEAQITLLFLTRLRAFKPDAGVYFPHYIERMLDLDGRSWLRQQRRGSAVPFSQLANTNDESSDPEEWLDLPDVNDETANVERALSLRSALDTLPESQRHVVWQCCVLGRTEVAVAEELGLSRSAVRNRLEAGITKMRSFFGHTEATTRTGRATSKPPTLQSEFWSLPFDMAKDEKRPDLVGVGAGRPVLLQGVYDFPATGLRTPELLSTKLTYTVPPGCVAGVRFLRAGIICDSMVCVSTVVNGMPHRLVPVAANSSAHVSFAIVEPLPAGSQVEIHIASDSPGTAIIDCGCLQMPG